MTKYTITPASFTHFELLVDGKFVGISGNEEALRNLITTARGLEAAIRTARHQRDNYADQWEVTGRELESTRRDLEYNVTENSELRTKINKLANENREQRAMLTDRAARELDIIREENAELRTERDNLAKLQVKLDTENGELRTINARLRAEHKLMINSVYGKGATQDVTITSYADTDSLVEGRKPYTVGELFNTETAFSHCKLCGAFITASHSETHTHWHNDVADL